MFRERFVLAGALALMVIAGAALAAVPVSGSQAAPRTAAAQIQRTFVSTSGSDANPCTRADPCRNFAAALANTLVGGEVVALDSGGYGIVAIDKAVTIVGAPGAHAAITAFAGDGIVVDADVTSVVTLRNLQVTGLGGSRGIFFQSGGALHVEHVIVSGFTGSGLRSTATTNLFVADSVFQHNGTGVSVDGTAAVEIVGTRSEANAGSAFEFTSTIGQVSRSAALRNNGTGFFVGSSAEIDISNSIADLNAQGVSVSGSLPVANLTAVVLSNNNGAGLATSDATALARIGGSTVVGNSTGLSATVGTLETYEDNLVRGNGLNTSGTITAVAKT